MDFLADGVRTILGERRQTWLIRDQYLSVLILLAKLTVVPGENVHTWHSQKLLHGGKLQQSRRPAVLNSESVPQSVVGFAQRNDPDSQL